MLSGENLMGAMEEFLASEDPLLRRTALQCITESAGPAEEGHVHRMLEDAISGDADFDALPVDRPISGSEALTLLA